MSDRKQNINGGGFFTSGQHQPTTSGSMQISRISSLSEAKSFANKVPTLSSSSSPLPSSSSCISSSSSSTRSSKAFKDLHQYLSDGTDSNVTLHGLFSDKPTFFTSPAFSNKSSSSSFILADSTTTTTSPIKSKNKRTLDDVEEEDRANVPQHQIINLNLTTFGGSSEADLDEATRQRLYNENLKTIERYLKSESRSSPLLQSPPIEVDSTDNNSQRQSVMMDVDEMTSARRGEPNVPQHNP